MSTSRVAVYLDFDNMVISRYDSLFGSGAWRKDNARTGTGERVAERLTQATVDIGAIIDYATSFGTVSMVRGYADWTVPANAAYKHQLVDRAVDLVQMFANSGTKNGADIRLSIDAVQDLLRHPDITHLVIVAGDSDYVSLAQRCKSLGRYVVGIGMVGSTSRALVAACDEFTDYADIPGVQAPAAPPKAVRKSPTPPEPPAVVDDGAVAGTITTSDAAPEEAPKRRRTVKAVDPQVAATTLLVRAMEVGGASEDGWMNSGGLKSQMQRLDPAFKEKSLGYSSFRAFVESREKAVETKVQGNGQLVVRLLPAATGKTV